MLRPIMNFKLDEEMLEFLLGEIEDSEKILHKLDDDHIKRLARFRSQLAIQMDEQGIKLTDVKEDKFLVRIVIPEDKRNYSIPPRTSFLLEGKPIGEIQSYNPETGIVIVHVQDPAIIEQINQGALPQLEVYEEAV